MTQPASRESILGAFDGRTLGGKHRVGRDGDVFWVESPPWGRRPVVMVTGSHHMQVYWVRPDPDDGRLVAFAYAYLLEEGQWTPNESTLLRPPQAEVTYTWNRVCIKCHAVAGVPGFEPSSGAVRSGAAELGIACEACHGPAQRHVELHRNPLTRYLGHLRPSDDAGIVHPGEMTGARASEICGQCHSITVFDDDDAWVQRGLDAAVPQAIETWGHVVRHPLRADQPSADRLLDDDPDYFADRFWTDGMVRVSGREYNGVVESPCATSPDFGCLSCHQMHGAAPNDQLETNDPDAPCRSCHASQADASVAHTHHAPDSSGSVCVNCHMPHTTYGLLKAIRSHEISNPNVADDAAAGRPNACNLCHVEQTLGWAAEAVARWYGQPRVDPSELGVPEPAQPAVVQWLLAGDAGQRAIAAWHLGWEPTVGRLGPDAVGLLAELLDDPYAAVRWVALRALRRQPGLADLEVDLESVDRTDVEAIRRGHPFDRARAQRLRAKRDLRPVALAE